ncbi:hypothetical protein Celaphus_00019273 [Cervus elaphus hippelaphus]|uniref:Uncharacterized protein n=1 Tax=Cervus elaphus hippelaphus TaxID=46360 RepID=A0A212C2V7_CEREH|nr:hypothetical protein Celaphus_00019273 [Cervus elaphus hippelaphus]
MDTSTIRWGGKDERKTLLGKFDTPDIRYTPHGIAQIEITFDANVHVILKVPVVDERIETEERIITTTDQSCLSKDDIEHLVEEVENYSHCS